MAVGRLLREPVAVQRRAVYRWLMENGAGEAVSFESVEAVRRMAVSEGDARLTLAGGVEVARRGEWLMVEDEREQRSVVSGQKSEGEMRVAVPGRTEVPALGVVVEVEMVTSGLPTVEAVANQKSEIRNQQSFQEWLDADAVGGALWLRCWRAGDRFQPIGMKRAKKLQDIFVDGKVPVSQRRRTPLLVGAGGEICWIAGYRIGEKFKITVATRRALRIRVSAL